VPLSPPLTITFATLVIYNRLERLTLITRSQVDRVESAIDRVSAQQNQTARLLSALVTTLAPQLPSSPPSFGLATGDVQCTFKVNIDSSGGKHSSTDPAIEKIGAMTRIPRTRPATPKDGMQIYTKKSASHCKEWCSCNCHKKSVLRAKHDTANVVGSFSLAYSGLPWMTAECNQKSCRSRSIPSVNMTVQFPAWFWKRYIAVSLTYAPTSGPSLNFKLPRTVDWSWKLWRYAPDGNLTAIQDLFAAGEASAWDVSPLGGSALHYAADHFQPDVCRFLIQQGAPADQEDHFKK